MKLITVGNENHIAYKNTNGGWDIRIGDTLLIGQSIRDIKRFIEKGEEVTNEGT